MEGLEGRDIQLVGTTHYIVPHVCYIDAAVDLAPYMERMEGAPYDWVVSVEVGEHLFILFILFILFLGWGAHPEGGGRGVHR